MMSTRTGSVAAVTLLLAACGGPTSAPNPAPVAEPAQNAPPVAATTDVGTPAPTVAPAQSLSGREVVDQICSECHSMEPPPLTAPPLTHLSRHLRGAFSTVDEAVAHVLVYAPAPDAQASILPPMAVERFGLMPPQPLPQPMLEAAARYIWSLSDGVDDQEPMGMGGGMRNGVGQGMQRGEGGGMGQGMQRGQGGRMGRGMQRGPGMQRGQGMHHGPGMQRRQGSGVGEAHSCPMKGAASDSTEARPPAPGGGGAA